MAGGDSATPRSRHKIPQVIAGRTMLPFDAADLIATAGLTVTFLVSSWLTVRRLFKAEPLPRQARVMTIR